MTSAQFPCLRCGNTAHEEGFVDDTVNGRVRWILGAPEIGLFGNARRVGRPRGVISAWRCINCSRLEFTVGEVS